MIYRRNGKLLVKNGKLCRSCCAAPGADCQYCEAGKTPLRLRVTFSGLIANDSCHPGQPGAGSNKIFGIVEALNDKSFIIEQDVNDKCFWWKGWDDSYFGEIVWYSDQNCVNYGNNYLLYLFIGISKSTGGTITIDVGHWLGVDPSPNSPQYFSYTGTPDITGCVGCEVDNQLTTDDFPWNGCHGGSVLIEEI